MTPTQLAVLRSICSAIVDAVTEYGPLGTRGEILYPALLRQGCNIDQFTQLMAGLVEAGLLSKRDDCYYPVYHNIEESKMDQVLSDQGLSDQLCPYCGDALDHTATKERLHAACQRALNAELDAAFPEIKQKFPDKPSEPSNDQLCAICSSLTTTRSERPLSLCRACHPSEPSNDRCDYCRTEATVRYARTVKVCLDCRYATHRCDNCLTPGHVHMIQLCAHCHKQEKK